MQLSAVKKIQNYLMVLRKKIKDVFYYLKGLIDEQQYMTRRQRAWQKMS